MRALVELALISGRSPASAAHIAARQVLSVAYLEQLLHRLRKGGLLKSIRGPRGGYVLARAPHEITLAEVVGILDGGWGMWETVESLSAAAENGSTGGAKPSRRTNKAGRGSEHASHVSTAVKRCVQNRLAESLGSLTLEDLCDAVRHADGEPLEHRYVFHI